MHKAFSRAVAVVGFSGLLLLTAGCGNSLPPETDMNQGRQALTAALDAWKDGRPPETLRDNKPPVDFRDVQWEKGSRLSGYQVKAEERSGLSARFTVQLQLQNKDGKVEERSVVYTVDVGQAVVIRPVF